MTYESFDPFYSILLETYESNKNLYHIQ